MATKTKTATKKRNAENIAQLELLATTVSDAYGGHFPTFLEELKTIQKGGAKVVTNKEGKTTFSMLGISAYSMLGGNAGNWSAAKNWSNAARRELNGAH